jgi:5-methylcytosine-specific restriction endonuclease McrA
MELKQFTKTPSTRLSREQFKKLAILCFIRDEYTCRECGRVHPIEQHALSAHHIKNRSQGGEDTLKNLATLCTFPCHRGVTDGLIPNNYSNED